MKTIIIVGLACILIGGLFCGAAYAFGERYIDSNLTETSDSFSAENVKKINISDYVAEIRFLKGGGGSTVSVNAENIIESEYHCSVTNNTLNISYNPQSVKFGFVSLPSFIFDYNRPNTPPVISIYIPEGHYFEEVYFNSGVGKIEAEEINTKSMILNGGVGAYDIKNMITENLDITVGVGSVKLNGTINGDTKIDGGVGEVKISGEANGNIKLKTGVGSAKLDFTGNIDDYNVKVSKGLGSVKLNGRNITDTYREQNGGKYNLDVDAGVGSIDINIK